MTPYDDFETGIKKFKKRQTLAVNKFKGDLEQNIFRKEQELAGNTVKRSPIAEDWIVTERDPITRKYKRTIHVEVKSSQTAPLRPLQEARKKKLGSRYKVHRGGW